MRGARARQESLRRNTPGRYEAPVNELPLPHAAEPLAGGVGAPYIAGMFIETETTPNPATLKFLPGQRVMPSGTRDFVSVTAAPGVDWGLLKPQVVAVLLDHFVSQAPLFAGGDASGILVPGEDDEDVGDDPADAEIVEQIKELIETRVRPAVANDGGDIRYRGFREGVIYLAMQGACSGCPSSTATLKQGIEGLLKHYVPEVTEVRAA